MPVGLALLALLLPAWFGLGALALAGVAAVAQTTTGLSFYDVYVLVLAAGTAAAFLTGLVMPSDRLARRALPGLQLAAMTCGLLIFTRITRWSDATALFILYAALAAAAARVLNKSLPGLLARASARAGRAVLVVLMSLLLLEGAARGLYGAPPVIDTGNTRPHPDRVFTLTPGYVGENIFASGSQEVHMPFAYSSQGLRDDEIGHKQPGEFRIVMLGDSYTIGGTLKPEETIPKQVQAKLGARLPQKITVINAGMAGYGPWQERGVLNEIGFPLNPDLVILQVLPSNDIDNTLSKVGKFPEACNTKWRARYQYFQFHDAWQMQADRRLRELSRVYNIVSDATRRPWVVDTSNMIRFVAPLHVPRIPPSAPRDPLIEINLRDWYPTLEKGWEIMQDDMRGIRNDCQSRGVGLMMYSIPIQTVLQDSWWLNATRGLDIYDREKDTQIVREFCAAENIPFIDILPALKNHPDMASLYYAPDGHFTPAGASLVAQTIADHLCASSFTNCKQE